MVYNFRVWAGPIWTAEGYQKSLSLSTSLFLSLIFLPFPSLSFMFFALFSLMFLFHSFFLSAVATAAFIGVKERKERIWVVQTVLPLWAVPCACLTTKRCRFTKGTTIISRAGHARHSRKV